MSPFGGSLDWKCTECSTSITEMKSIKPFEKQTVTTTQLYLKKTDVKVAFSTVHRLLASPSTQLPDQLGDDDSLCKKFASFFTDKIDRICTAVDSVPVTTFDLNHDTDFEQSPTTTLHYSKETSETEVGKKANPANRQHALWTSYQLKL